MNHTDESRDGGVASERPDRHVDVAIIGAGTAGLSARRAAKAAGASVLMVDPGPFGTTCARVGCMPSKLLIAAADAAHHARETSRFGVHTSEVVVDGPAVLGRVQSERDRFVGFVGDVIDEARADDELVVGRATVVGPGRMRVDVTAEADTGADTAAGSDSTVVVGFDRLVVAAGSAPFVPPPFRGLEHLLLTNEEVFELSDLPKSLLVIGLGVVGLELGQAFDRLGVRTTLLGVGGAVGPLTDPRVLAYAKRTLTETLDLHPDYQLEALSADEHGVTIDFVDSAGRTRSEHFERVLVAAGRRSNLGRLGLSAMGIEPEQDGRYRIDPDTLQLGDHDVFVAGDVNGLHPLLHEAADDGRIAGRNAARSPDIRAASRRTPLAVAFSDPQIAIVGAGYGALGDCEAVAGEIDYADQGRARVAGINEGLVRIYADKHTARLLGAEMFGPRVEHLSHLLAWAIQSGLTVDEALQMPFYHPVLEEGLRTALRSLAANLRHGAPIKCAVSELGVGA